MLKGTYTALVTPFQADKKIDQPALERLLADQLAGGINGLVPCGTTGETPTLSDVERDLVIGTTVKVAAKKVPVIAGTGSNSILASSSSRCTPCGLRGGTRLAPIERPGDHRRTTET